MPDQEKYQIVLEKVPYERQPEAALFLSGSFSLPPASTRGIVASGPITLLSGLTKAQAEAVIEELKAGMPEGVELRLAAENDPGKYSRLQWPRPPRIYGRDLSDFISQQNTQDIHCPLCGGHLRITNDDTGVRAVTATDSARRGGMTTRRILTASDKDPLFSGVKPLATADTNYASLRSLEAGDTGFWMDYSNSEHDTSPPHEPPAARTPGKESSTGKKGTNRNAAGLSAFMKPGGFALVVSRTKDPQAVKMISEIMGISQDEARDKCLNLGLCVAKDIALDEAQNLLARFRNLGAKARIVRPT